jgi:hypothetical protein
MTGVGDAGEAGSFAALRNDNFFQKFSKKSKSSGNASANATGDAYGVARWVCGGG